MASKKVAGAFFIIDRHNNSRAFPNPKDGKIDGWNAGQARFACNSAIRNREKCKEISVRLNNEIDGDISCRFGKPTRKTMEAIHGGIAAGTDVASNFTNETGTVETAGEVTRKGVAAAGEVNSCHLHKLRDGETVEQIFSTESYTPE